MSMYVQHLNEAIGHVRRQAVLLCLRGPDAGSKSLLCGRRREGVCSCRGVEATSTDTLGAGQRRYPAIFDYGT